MSKFYVFFLIIIEVDVHIYLYQLLQLIFMWVFVQSWKKFHMTTAVLCVRITTHGMNVGLTALKKAFRVRGCVLLLLLMFLRNVVVKLNRQTHSFIPNPAIRVLVIKTCYKKLLICDLFASKQ